MTSSTENSSGSIRPDRDASLWTETSIYISTWNTLAVRFVPPKNWETNSEIGFYTAGCIEKATDNCLKYVIESGCQSYGLCWLFMAAQTDGKQQDKSFSSAYVAIWQRLNISLKVN